MSVYVVVVDQSAVFPAMEFRGSAAEPELHAGDKAPKVRILQAVGLTVDRFSSLSRVLEY